jgi:hypothetical protein
VGAVADTMKEAPTTGQNANFAKYTQGMTNVYTVVH